MIRNLLVGTIKIFVTATLAALFILTGPMLYQEAKAFKASRTPVAEDTTKEELPRVRKTDVQKLGRHSLVRPSVPTKKPPTTAPSTDSNLSAGRGTTPPTTPPEEDRTTAPKEDLTTPPSEDPEVVDHTPTREPKLPTQRDTTEPSLVSPDLTMLIQLRDLVTKCGGGSLSIAGLKSLFEEFAAAAEGNQLEEIISNFELDPCWVDALSRLFDEQILARTSNNYALSR